MLDWSGPGSDDADVGEVVTWLDLAGGPREPGADGPRGGLPAADHGHNHDCPDPIELILFVDRPASGSPKTIAAIRRTLSRFASAKVKLTICDVPLGPGKDEVIVPGGESGGRVERPRTFILGHITSPEIALELLESCDDGQPA